LFARDTREDAVVQAGQRVGDFTVGEVGGNEDTHAARDELVFRDGVFGLDDCGLKRRVGREFAPNTKRRRTAYKFVAEARGLKVETLRKIRFAEWAPVHEGSDESL
jgi:hypothetical protein